MPPTLKHRLEVLTDVKIMKRINKDVKKNTVLPIKNPLPKQLVREGESLPFQ